MEGQSSLIAGLPVGGHFWGRSVTN